MHCSYGDQEIAQELWRGREKGGVRMGLNTGGRRRGGGEPIYELHFVLASYC